MLRVQVLGRGLIPRGLGLAPRKELFKVDLMALRAIVNSPGLTVNMFNPEKKRLVPLTRENIDRMWEKYNNWEDENDTPKDIFNRPEVKVDPAEVFKNSAPLPRYNENGLNENNLQGKKPQIHNGNKNNVQPAQQPQEFTPSEIKEVVNKVADAVLPAKTEEKKDDKNTSNNNNDKKDGEKKSFTPISNDKK